MATRKRLTPPSKTKSPGIVPPGKAKPRKVTPGPVKKRRGG